MQMVLIVGVQPPRFGVHQPLPLVTRSVTGLLPRWSVGAIKLSNRGKPSISAQTTQRRAYTDQSPRPFGERVRVRGQFVRQPKHSRQTPISL